MENAKLHKQTYCPERITCLGIFLYKVREIPFHMILLFVFFATENITIVINLLKHTIMKKQLIMMACMLMASIAAFAGTNSKILLQHEGGVKVYDSNQMTQALADAVKGDTIFLPEGSFIKDDERNITLLDLLSKTKEITVKPLRNKNDSHKPQKTLLISNKSKSQKFISSRKIKSSSHFNVYNNYQNIIIPQGNTIININNNYYNNGSIRKVNQQLKLFSGMLSPQPSSRSNNIYKSSSIEKKTITNFKSSKNMLTERPKSTNFLNIAECRTIYKRKNDTLYTQRNNTIVAKIKRKGSNQKISTKQNEKLLINSEGYKSQVSLKVNHLLSPKHNDKTQSTAMKTKYKAFIQKSKDLALRNSSNTFISTHKSNKCFHTISSNAISVNKKIKKDNSTTRSTPLSPHSVNKSSSLKNNSDTSPLVRRIKVNRKKYFEKIKGQCESLNTIEYQTYENTINTKFNTIQNNDFK